VARACEERGRRQPTESRPDDDDAARGHGYSPSVMPVTN
jgi:hypothetical protein